MHTYLHTYINTYIHTAYTHTYIHELILCTFLPTFVNKFTISKKKTHEHASCTVFSSLPHYCVEQVERIQGIHKGPGLGAKICLFPRLYSGLINKKDNATITQLLELSCIKQ